MTNGNLLLKIRNNIATLTWLENNHPSRGRIVEETYFLILQAKWKKSMKVSHTSTQYGIDLGNLYNEFNNILDSELPTAKEEVNLNQQ